MTLRHFALLLRTARHLQFSQIAWRLVRTVRAKRRSLLRAKPPGGAGAKRNPAFRTSWPGVAECNPERAREIAAGRFTFLGVTRETPSWNQPDVSQLWRFHLHYFDSVAALAAIDPDEGFSAFRSLVRSWIDGNRFLVGDGWHAYTASLRIVNWCEAGAFFAANLDGDPAFDAAFHQSLFGQARFLAGNLENDLGGNHLIKNLRALVWASAYFTGREARKWRDTAVARLRREIGAQVLPDGGHFERVPGYHLQVLDDLRAMHALLLRENEPQPWLAEAVTRMEAFLRAIMPASARLPSRLPLLKDTTFERSAAEFVAPPQPSRYLESSGFAVIRDDARTEHLIVDVGKPCPDHLPAHAHADLFSYELTDREGPLVVDSGVYVYAAGTWRDWFRSTAAHNTVEVAGCNQSEVWGSFRVARRARPANVRWIEHGALHIVQGEHDGYRRLDPSVTHRRTVVAGPGWWLFVDELFGEGSTSAASRIHIHPDRTIGALNLAAFGARMHEERGWYSEQFGEKQANDVIVLEAEGAMPLHFGYGITTSSPMTLHSSVDADGCIVRVSGVATLSLILDRHAAPRIEGWDG